MGVNQEMVGQFVGYSPSFSVATDIAPQHWWLASQNTQSGGLVDSLNDQGSSPLNFTQTGAARAPVATDANGKTYLALDGAADFYQAGAVADWAYLHNGSSYTIALVYNRAALITAFEVLLDTCDFTTNNIGHTIFLDYSSATVQGIRNFVGSGVANQSPIGCTSRTPYTSITTAIIRFSGDNTTFTNTAGNIPVAVDMQMRRRGVLVSSAGKSSFNYNIANPAYTLTMGRRANTAGNFSAARMYEVLIDNKAWSDRQITQYEDYARSRYLIAM